VRVVEVRVEEVAAVHDRDARGVEGGVGAHVAQAGDARHRRHHRRLLEGEERVGDDGIVAVDLDADALLLAQRRALQQLRGRREGVADAARQLGWQQVVDDEVAEGRGGAPALRQRGGVALEAGGDGLGHRGARARRRRGSRGVHARIGARAAKGINSGG
jgi:hypothetical protein